MNRVNILILLCLVLSVTLIMGATWELQQVLAFHGWHEAAQPAAW